MFLVIAIFLVDCLLPQDYAVWIFYLIPLLLMLAMQERVSPLALAMVCTLLLVAGYFLSPPNDAPVVDLVGRAASIITAWIAAVLFLQRTRMVQQLRAALAEAQRFRDALDQVATFVYMKDLQSRYVYANQQTLKLFGCSAQQLAGCDDSHFFPPETARRLRQMDLRVLEGNHITEEVEVPATHDRRRFFWDVKTPIYSERTGKKMWGLLGISTDITALKQTEELLRQHNTRLEEELGKIKALHGLLPICSGCKKIRDDKHAWIQIESYLAQHADVSFTHGLCPDCLQKYFPNLVKPAPKREPEAPR